jgi:hypothetical protein
MRGLGTIRGNEGLGLVLCLKDGLLFIANRHRFENWQCEARMLYVENGLRVSRHPLRIHSSPFAHP